jgi:hypothetical protein
LQAVGAKQQVEDMPEAASLAAAKALVLQYRIERMGKRIAWMAAVLFPIIVIAAIASIFTKKRHW